MTSGFADTSDLRRRKGDARPPVVLIHGLGVDHRMWALQIAALQEVGQPWAPDLPGFDGVPRGVSRPETPEELADWLAEEMQARGLAGAAIAGYSMGGTVALLLALRHPSRVGRLALCCSSPCWGRGLRKPIALAFARLGGERAMDLFEKSVLWGFLRHCGDPALKSQVLDMVAKADRRSMLRLYRRLALLDLRPRLGEVRVPTLVVGGSRDWLAPPAHQRTFAAGIPGARLAMLRGADHILCLGRPEEFSSVLADFFGAASGGAVEEGAR